MGSVDPEKEAYGCLFCMAGTEKIVSQLISYKYGRDVQVTPALYERHRTRQGEKWRDTAVFMPGYVFFRCREDIFLPYAFPRDRGYRLLKNEEGDWRLQDQDREYARWLLSYDGLLPFSTACEEQDRIRILSGPMKDREGYVEKIDRRGRSALVRLEFQGRVFRVWLGFELIVKDIPGGVTSSEGNA